MSRRATGRTRQRIGPALALWLALGAAAGCARDDRRTLVVLAASSLTDAFAALEADFEAAHPDVDVIVSSAGSQVVRQQVEEGARADVLATANPEHMDALADADLVRDVQTLAHNTLVIVTPADDPAGVGALADLPSAERIVLGGELVPVGRYARELLGAAATRGADTYGADFGDRVLARVVSFEPNTRLVLAKVEIGEADAAVVYRTDARDRDVRIVEVDAALVPRAEYRIAVVAESDEPELAAEWIALATGAGAARLQALGFDAP